MSSPSQLLRPDVGQRTQSSASGTSPPAGGIPNIPLPASSRRGSHSQSAGEESSSRRPTPSPHPSSSNVNDGLELTDEQKAAIVGRHLVGRQGQRRASRKASNVNAGGAGASSAVAGGSTSIGKEEEEEEEAVASDEEGSAAGDDDDDGDDEDARRVKHMQESTDEFPVSGAARVLQAP